MIYSLLKALPGNQGTKVAVGTFILMSVAAVPVWMKGNQKRGHDLFSSEKPEAVENALAEKQKKLVEKAVPQ